MTVIGGPTDRVTPQDVQHAGLRNGLKVGPAHHAVYALPHEVGVAQVTAHCHGQLPQFFTVGIRHTWEPNSKPKTDEKEEIKKNTFKGEEMPFLSLFYRP